MRWIRFFQSLVKIPEELSYEEAATLPCAGVVAWSSLHGPVPVKAGDVVLVQGTGGVSMWVSLLMPSRGSAMTSSSTASLFSSQSLLVLR